MKNMEQCKFQLLTITYDKDLEWLKYCLKSIDKFAKKYSGHTIVIDDNHDCQNTLLFLRENNIRFFVNKEAKTIKHGYIRQQYMKMICDQYVPEDTDWIIHIDSDSVFFEEHDPSIYFSKNNKPIMLMTPYNIFKDGEVPWQKPTEEFIKDAVKYEFMRRMPLIYPKWIFPEIREWIYKNHHKTLFQYLENKLPLEFSEYNALGAYLYKHYRDLYEWIDTITQPYEQLPLLQMRSWDGISSKIDIIKNLIENPEIHCLLKKIMQKLCVTIDYRDIRIKDIHLLLGSTISKMKLDK